MEKSDPKHRRKIQGDLALRVVAAWFLALVFPGCLLGVVLVVFAIYSVPFLLLGMAVALIFWERLLSKPWVGAATAAVTTPLLSAIVLGRLGLVAVIVSVPAAGYFLLLQRAFPLRCAGKSSS